MTKGEPWKGDSGLSPFERRLRVLELVTPMRTLPTILRDADLATLNAVPHELDHATALPTGVPLLAETYDVLTTHLSSRTTSLAVRFAMVAIGDSLRCQTRLPIEQREGYKLPELRSNFLARAELFEDTQRPTPQSMGSTRRLERTLDDTLIELAETTHPKAASLNELRADVAVVSDLTTFLTSPLYATQQLYGNPHTTELLAKHASQYLMDVAGNPRSHILLLNGELEGGDADLAFFAWRHHHMLRALRPDLEPATTKLLGDYLLEHPSASKKYWGIVAAEPGYAQPREETGDASGRIQTVPIGYSNADWYFSQDPETLQTFLGTVPLEGKPTREKLALLKRLFSYAGIFKTLYPDHPNTAHLTDGITSVVSKSGLRSEVTNFLRVLTDDKPGIIYIDKPPETTFPHTPSQVKLKTPKAGDSLATLLEGIELENVHYISKKAIAETQISKVARAETRPSRPILTEGENVFRPYWHDTQKPRAEELPAVLNYLQSGFAEHNPDEDQLFDLHASLTVPRNLEGAKRRAVIIPNILPEQHQLRPFSNIGIIGVQHEGHTIRVVVDAQTAGMITDGPRLVTLSGYLGKDGLVIEHAPDEFLWTPLQQALTAAALLSYKEPAKVIDDKAQKKIDEGLQRAGEWNRHSRTSNYPTISRFSPINNAIGVVYPFNQQQEVKLFSLE